MPAFDFVLAGRYRLVAPLGEGGMASVYRGRDLRLNRDVAIKVLREDLTRDPEFLSRFQREAQVVASLTHPNIVSVYDVGEEGGSHFIVMEYVRGRTLKETIDSQGAMSSQRAVEVMVPVLEALDYAHHQHLVHRDVKPHNILLTPDGTPRLADFGIAHIVDGSTTRTAAILGSAHYLSPEQSRGEEATVLSDIYASGIVLYEMLSGRPPFDGANALAIAHQHLYSAPDPIASNPENIPPDLAECVMRALEKDPRDRFEDARTFGSALAGTQHDRLSTQVHPLPDKEALPAVSPAEVVRIEPEDNLVARRSARKMYVLTAGLVAVGLIATYAASLPLWGRTLAPNASVMYAFLPVALLVGLALSRVHARSWVYSVNGDVAVVQWGILGHHRFGLPMHGVATLQLKQSPIDRVLGIGTIELCARDEHGQERQLVMEDLPRPRKTYDELMRLIGRSARARPSA
jgi:eukaryotic-like serine/threonine-protein kinase